MEPNMRICGKHIVALVLTSLALAGCGEDEEGAAGGNGNLAPLIAGTPPTTLAAGTAYSFTPSAADPESQRGH